MADLGEFKFDFRNEPQPEKRCTNEKATGRDGVLHQDFVMPPPIRSFFCVLVLTSEKSGHRSCSWAGQSWSRKPSPFGRYPSQPWLYKEGVAGGEISSDERLLDYLVADELYQGERAHPRLLGDAVDGSEKVSQTLLAVLIRKKIGPRSRSDLCLP
jgi:hypothetical protein